MTERERKIQGVGYRVSLMGRVLAFEVGLSHVVWYERPEGVGARVGDSGTSLVRTSSFGWKGSLGDVAHRLCLLRPRSSYTGNGIQRASPRVPYRRLKSTSSRG